MNGCEKAGNSGAMERVVIVVVYRIIRRFTAIKELCGCCYALICILKKCGGKIMERNCIS
jgi:hypothetical protein